MLTRGVLKTNLRDNLQDSGTSNTFFQDQELNDSLQDAYNEVIAKTRCLVKKATSLQFKNSLGYIDFINDYNITDYLGTIAIFNRNTNLFLQDNVSLKDLDRMRLDWEQWEGQPIIWTPHSLQYIVMAPRFTTASGLFDLYYWANAPTFTDDTTQTVIATDMDILLEDYATVDAFETKEEPMKGSTYNARYYQKIVKYAARCQNLASADVLLRI